MKFQNEWVASKYEYHRGALRASRDRGEVGVGSRLIGDLVARFYDQNLPAYALGKLIDLGCGKVPLYGTYKNHVSEVTCVDWSDPAKERSHLDQVCDLGKPLPFETGEFDTVILSDVLEHVPKPELLWSEISRLLAPGGRLLMNTPFLHCLHEQPHDYHRFTEHALRLSAESNGFEILQLRPLGGTPEVLTDIIAKHLQYVPVVGTLLSRSIQWLTFQFVKTKPGKSISNKTSSAFPLGYTLIAQRNGQTSGAPQ